MYLSAFLFLFFMMSIVSVMSLYACPMFNIWSEYPELSLLFHIACMCSFYLSWDVVLFILCTRISVDNLGISIVKCNFCRIYLFATVVL
jgi:cytochrome c oxidase assembly factor CtaG